MSVLKLIVKSVSLFLLLLWDYIVKRRDASMMGGTYGSDEGVCFPCVGSDENGT